MACAMEAVKRKFWSESENGVWCENLTRALSSFKLDFEKKPDCLQSTLLLEATLQIIDTDNIGCKPIYMPGA